MKNPSLNIFILSCGLCLLGFIGGWMCMNGLLVIMAFGPLLGLWPQSFFVLLRDHGSRRNISENVQFPAKIQHAPKSRTKSKTVKFGCQVEGQYMNHPEEFTKITPNNIVKWVLKERQQLPTSNGQGVGLKSQSLSFYNYCNFDKSK